MGRDTDSSATTYGDSSATGARIRLRSERRAGRRLAKDGELPRGAGACRGSAGAEREQRRSPQTARRVVNARSRDSCAAPRARASQARRTIRCPQHQPWANSAPDALHLLVAAASATLAMRRSRPSPSRGSPGQTRCASLSPQQAARPPAARLLLWCLQHPGRLLVGDAQRQVELGRRGVGERNQDGRRRERRWARATFARRRARRVAAGLPLEQASRSAVRRDFDGACKRRCWSGTFGRACRGTCVLRAEAVSLAVE